MMKKHTKKFILTVATIVMVNGFLLAQQDPQYSQYMFNKMAYNPAYAGSEDAISTTLLVRNQWIDFDGHPMTQTLHTHMPIDAISSGAGLYLVRDALGAEQSITAMLSYSYILRLSGVGNISAGLSGGLIKKSLDGTKLRSPEGNYNDPDNPIHNDTHIPTALEGNSVFDMGAGLYFKNDKFDLGFSITHLSAPKIKYDNPPVDVTQVMNYYLTTGFNFPLSQNVDLKPSMKLKTDQTKTQVDLNSLIVYRKNIWTGLSYRGINSKDNSDAFVAIAGLNLTPNLIFGYSYDITTSALRGASSGSHEFLLNYKFNIVKPVKPEKIIYCPRFL